MGIRKTGSAKRRVGLALSGGAIRGLAHIGVIKALQEANFEISVVAGTSVGSLVGAALAAGKDWRAIAEMAASVFWPRLLHSDYLERFCSEHLPETFDRLTLPFAAVTTKIENKETFPIREGRLASAINASCALPAVRRRITRDGIVLEDGGTTCVLPSEICRQMGADFVIASDVWGVAWCLRVVGCDPTAPVAGKVFPLHYRKALHSTDVLVQPPIPAICYMPGRRAVESMVAVGEKAALAAFPGLLKETT